MSETKRVLITCMHLQRCIEDYRSILSENGLEAIVPHVDQGLSEDEMIANVPGIVGAIVGDDVVSGPVLRAAKDMKILVKWGIGTDGIDFQTAKELGIKVVNTPGAFGAEVADVVVGYMVMLTRQLHTIDRAVRAGEWRQVPGTSLAGKTIGIIGAGNIGAAVATRATAMDMKVICHDVVPIPKPLLDIGVTEASKETLLADSDLISLNCPLTSGTRHIIDKDAVSRMRNGVLVINTSRGPLIDETALLSGLDSGKIAGAALDVFEEEPLPGNSRLREFEQCIFGAHNSSNTREAVDRVNQIAIQKLLENL